MTLARENVPNFIRKRGVSDENANIGDTATKFRQRFDAPDATPEQRQANATTLVNEYYDLVTDFYEYGWGHSTSRHATKAKVSRSRLSATNTSSPCARDGKQE